MKLIESGDVISIGSITATHNRLPPGNYLLQFHPEKGFYLVRKANFILPKKIYGDNHEIGRWLYSFKHNSEKNMGIILSGLKGTGKTITAHEFCNVSKMPVIIINDPFMGGSFINFITNPLFENCIIFIDEFEKIYKEGQEDRNPGDFLALMDGNYTTRLIFLLTVNDMTISDFMINRPGRIKYRKHYDNLPANVLDEVIDDLLINKENKTSVIDFFSRLGIVTFDLVTSLIKDMNLFNEDALTCARYLNVRAEPVYYDIVEMVNGKPRPCEDARISSMSHKIRLIRKDYFKGTPSKGYEDQEEQTIILDLQKSKLKRHGVDSLTVVTPEKQIFNFMRKFGEVSF